MSDGGPVALVTGATGGIGGAIARRLAQDGVRVIATGRDESEAQDVADALLQETGTSCLGVQLDVTNQGSLEALAVTAQSFGPVDWLVNNAGLADTSPVTSAGNQPLLRRMMEVNFYGALRLFALFGPEMVGRGNGRVLQIASSAALQGYPYVSAYSTTKHALLGWSRSAALELAPKGVGVSVICPHYVDSPLTDRSIEAMQKKTGRTEDDLRAFIASQNPSGVIVAPDEVGEAALRLLRSTRSGVVVELPGGSEHTIDEGVEIETEQEQRSR